MAAVKSDSHSLSQDPPKILMVDDDFFNLEVMRGTLMMHNLDSDAVSNGYQALDLIKKRIHVASTNKDISMYKLIFIDYSMPVMDGVELTRQIYNIFNNDKRHEMPQIICLTAYSDQRYKDSAL